MANTNHATYTSYAAAKLLADQAMELEREGWLYKVEETGEDSGRWTIDVYNADDKYVGTF